MIRLLILTLVGGFSFAFGGFLGTDTENASADNAEINIKKEGTFLDKFKDIFSSSKGDPTDPERDKVIQKTVLTVLEQVHFDPVELTDEFSSEVFDDFLGAIDGRKRFLTKEDIATLEVYRDQLDDQANQGSLEFFDLAIGILEERIEESKTICKEVLASPFDFKAEEIHEFDPDKKDYPANAEARKEVWRKMLKYDALDELEGALTKQEKDLKSEDQEVVDNAKEEKKTLVEMETAAREAVGETFTEWFKNIGKVKRSDRYEAYINAFTHIFDPHSDYFNPKEKQDFDISMGGKLEGIGARLRTEGDLTQVVSIVPGGPVWKNKEIEVNDYILAVTQKEEEAVDVFGMRIDDVVSMIRGDKGTFVTLKIQKKDGSSKDVELERDVVNIEDSFAKSAILDLPGTVDEVGYIHLPKFYSSFDGPEGNSCAVDVGEEIEKLKKNNVNGIILDLRSNGGGSLPDVVDMTGLFIEDGPIVQVKPRGRAPFIYNDKDEEVKYDGPLIVLINSFSASASEILAAALQDYDRALIVGTQSYGKGTVQRFIDLDRAVRGNSEFKPLGALKITMQKFYRIDGGSTQLRGVTPDINLPDRYSLIDVGEREYPHAMAWSELSALEFDQDVYKINNKEYFKNISEQRIAQSDQFALINEQAKWYKENRDKTSYSLNLDNHRAFLEAKEEESEKFSVIMSENIEGLVIKNLPEDEESIAFDETTQARNESWIKARNKDIYLAEALAIMRDVINGKAYTSIRKDEIEKTNP
ncbi:MAG: carboxyl-terminal processing protease [Saprospiraceae bacterium]|jgi:carboxyl-terminal processing protease